MRVIWWLAVVTVSGTAACASDHRVSPWIEGVRWGDISAPANLDENLARVRAEIESGGMAVEGEREGKFAGGEPFVLMGLRGADAVGRTTHAVRMVTPYGIVLAVGPGDSIGQPGKTRTRLVESLVAGGGWNSGTDLNADGLLDVVIAGGDETFEMWGVHPQGSSPYPMQGWTAPTTAMDVDEDGRPDPAGLIHITGADPIGPRLVEVMVFDGGTYRADEPSVRRWHAKEAADAMTLQSEGDAGPQQALPAREELAQALETAWNRLRAGEAGKQVLLDLDVVARRRAPLEPGVAQAWVKWRGKLQDLFPQEEAREGPP